jgi:hypothetical protein
MSPEATKVLSEITEAVRPLVALVEAAPKTSRDNYVEYIAVIDRCASMLAGDGPAKHHTIGVALIRAGAPARGVLDALRTMGYLNSECI